MQSKTEEPAFWQAARPETLARVKCGNPGNSRVISALRTPRTLGFHGLLT